MSKYITKKKKTNHILHLLLSVVTGGLWLIVWLFLIITPNGSEKMKIED